VRNPLAYLCGLALLAGCPDDPLPTGPSPDGGLPDGSPPPHETCLPGCEGSRAYDALAYDLRGSFQHDVDLFYAEETVTLAIPAGASRIVELDAVVEVTGVSDGAKPLPYHHADGKLRVDLSEAAGSFVVAYTAPLSDGLRLYEPRDGDPVAARVYYTNSEPDRARKWLVSNDHPSDRATFSVTLVVGADEDAIANGNRVAFDPPVAGKSVRYVMADPIPTYLMAFAAGDLVHTDRTTGRVPLAIWHRAGAPVDTATHLDVVAGAMALFESLLGPYPFDSYAVVLLPGFPGGMENATITFNSEASGQASAQGMTNLNAHELGHHWFGDWVTMHDYDDVWIKEGMATLLASEATKAFRDNPAGRHMGMDFEFFPEDAIIDPALTGLAKYTSGPYERAAWTLQQIRVLVGEEAFWGTLRQILADHALGTITTDAFVAAFAPALGAAKTAELEAALYETEVPQIEIGLSPVEGGTVLTFAVDDDSGTLLAPLQITSVDAAGAATVVDVSEGTPAPILVPFGGYLAYDELGVHPSWSLSFVVSDTYFDITDFFAPTTAETRAALAERSASAQERSILETFTWFEVDPAGFATLFDGLDTHFSRFLLQRACGAARNLPAEERDAWFAVLGPRIVANRLQQLSTGWARCGTVLPAAYLAAEVDELLDDPSAAAQTRLEFLASFDYGATGSLEKIGAMATKSPSLRLRDQAVLRLTAHLVGTSYSPVTDREPWKAFFRARLAETTHAGRFGFVFQALTILEDVTILPEVARLLHEITFSSAQERFVVCTAFDMSDGDANWVQFQAAAQPWESLSPAAQAVLADPATCAGALLTPISAREHKPEE
jgi:aminopeptidase N